MCGATTNYISQMTVTKFHQILLCSPNMEKRGKSLDYPIFLDLPKPAFTNTVLTAVQVESDCESTLDSWDDGMDHSCLDTDSEDDVADPFLQIPEIFGCPKLNKT